MAKSVYHQIIEAIFFDHFRDGLEQFEFERPEIQSTAEKLRLKTPKNLGDVVYRFRYRYPLPSTVQNTCGEDEEWIIKGVSKSRYRFRRVPLTKIEPQRDLYRTKIPDATPEIVAEHALNDEQAVLAKVRYNRLVDLFTGTVAYSLQSHLRTQVNRVQIEIDELYIAVDKHGVQYIIPVQAKGGKDRVGRVQLEQDMDFCAERFSDLVCRPIAAQSLEDDVIAMFELTIQDDRVQILQERHYRLVSADLITTDDLSTVRRQMDGSH